MVLDGHMHIMQTGGGREAFLERLAMAGVGGGTVMSLPPPSFPALGETRSPRERLDNLFTWTGSHPDLYPFYWIDPVEQDALEQVALANGYGVMGFKVICNHFSPGDERALPVYAAIAASRKPILFHSGILWDGQDSSRYNRPAEFEALLQIAGLRFCLAHISWPWCDECIAVYGKFQSARRLREELSCEMFVDITPGTPPIYRREALAKLFTVGYDVASNVIFGSDCRTHAYDVARVKECLARDRAILEQLEVGEQVIAQVYRENLRRFVGVSA